MQKQQNLKTIIGKTNFLISVLGFQVTKMYRILQEFLTSLISWCFSPPSFIKQGDMVARCTSPQYQPPAPETPPICHTSNCTIVRPGASMAWARRAGTLSLSSTSGSSSNKNLRYGHLQLWIQAFGPDPANIQLDWSISFRIHHSDCKLACH